MTASDTHCFRWRSHFLSIAAVLALTSCSAGDGPNGPGDPLDPNDPNQPDPPGPGQNGSYDFISANPSGGSAGSPDMGYADASWDTGGGFEDVAAGADVGETPNEPGEVTRGDIFRRLGTDRIVNLNVYRGLQVIDLADPDHPAIIGQLPVDGRGIEMQLAGDMAVLLLTPSDWAGTTVVAAVDLSDPSAPRLAGEAELEGQLSTTRLVTRGERAHLYVVTSDSGYYWEGGGSVGADGGWGEDAGGGGIWYSSARVASFEVGSGGLTIADSLELGGAVTAVQATPELLMVARGSSDWGSQTEVALVDISDPDGLLAEAGSTPVAGFVGNLFNMDVHNGVLRVVSTEWGINHVETFDASDPGDLVLLDHETFGPNEDLYATLFLGNKAFFVTFMRTDPFHAFAIGDDGSIEEKAEFIVSGWNDFFVPAFSGDRLIGVGTDGGNVAISLYDTTDLSNPEPLLARTTVEAAGSWSEAQFDDRALTVVEDAVEVEGANGVVETGLVLVPFSAWDDASFRQVGGVQIYTFSRDTLTRRGVMEDGSGQVRRSFPTAEGIAANLSDTGLRLFDTSDPDAPVARGFVRLASIVGGVLTAGEHILRVLDDSGSEWSWGAASAVEVVATDGNVDIAPAAATIELDGWGQLAQVGDLLVGLIAERAGDARVSIWDLSDPLAPRTLAEVTGADAEPFVFGPEGGDCWDCWRAPARTMALENALAALTRTIESELLHYQEDCWIEPDWSWESCAHEGCTNYEGAVSCTRIVGSTETCSGEIVRCTYAGCEDGWCDSICEPVDPATAPTTRWCSGEYPVYNYSARLDLAVLDLSDPASPAVASVSMPEGDDADRVLADGDGIYYGFSRPVSLPGDDRSYAAYYLRRIDLSNPSAPLLGEPVNVPGQVVAADGDRILLEDYAWTDDGLLLPSVAVVRLESGRANLVGRYELPGREIRSIAVDEAGLVLVTHDFGWFNEGYEETCWTDRTCYETRLTVLGPAGATAEPLPMLGETALGDWSQFLGVHGDRALYRTGMDLLVVGLSDPAQPRRLAQHGIRSYELGDYAVVGRTAYIPDGPWGIRTIDLDTINLEE